MDFFIKFLLGFLLIIVVPFYSYYCLRIWATAIFKSYFEEKKRSRNV